MNISTIKTVSIYGTTHLLIDLTCIMVLYSTVIYMGVGESTAFTIIVLYNILAFGLQSIIGDIFDKIKKPRLCAIIGCILTAISAIFWKQSLFAGIMAGIGNAFFHVGGGIICLKEGNKKAAIPGIYVAPGALGLFIGGYAAKNSLFNPEMLAPVLVIFSILIILNKYNTCENSPLEINIKYNKFIIIVNLLLFAILIRSFVGMSITLPWKSNLSLVIALTLAVVLGKSLGGIIADKFGWLKTTVFALIISSPLIAFCINYPILYILGIFFFNFTMPVTLIALSNIMPKREGFAFGLTTLALIIGAFPSFLNINLTSNNAITIFLIVIISALFIYYGLKEYYKNNKTNL